MIDREDVGGVHIKYLYHCPRQLWLYARGIRPEHLSSTVRFGEAVHETSYRRGSPIDLGAAQLDFVDGRHWVHEVKSSGRPRPADQAQGRHYCLRLHALGIDVQGTVLHYPAIRRTQRFPFTPEEAEQAGKDITAVLDTVTAPTSPDRLPKARCHGCAFTDYCWTE